MDDFLTAGDASVYAGPGSVADKLDRARTELLDLSARNRLLNMPKSGKAAKTIEVVDEISAEIFRLLITESKAFTFLPGTPSRKAASPDDPPVEGDDPEEESDIIQELALPEDDALDERGIAGRHSDTKFQTRFTPEGLQKRLLDLYYDAKTLEDEQGVNVLYLTLGALRWVDPTDKKNIRRAPLLLLPVSLERGSAGERFRLRARPEDFATNLSLETFLDRLHGIRLPEIDTEGFDPKAYFDIVAQAIEGKEGWGVEPDVILLGFFSFAKFMMYRDLDPANWPDGASITDRPLLKSLLADGFEAGEALYPDNISIDPIIAPADLHHILDSDSSQSLAVHEVRRGRNLVIQGPPGTGKSQTIANLIAAAIADGRTVLFVAEKMAALEVVKRRLDASGVGAACLELHSHKANKKAVLEEIRRTWENGAPRTGDIGSLNARLGDLRDELNGHAARMHAVHQPSGLTPYQVQGQLVRLRAAGEEPNDIALDAPESWTAEAFAERHAVLRELAERVEEIGTPAAHLWHGVRITGITPMEGERLAKRLGAAAAESAALDEAAEGLAALLGTAPPETRAAADPLIATARRITAAPLSPAALATPAWHDDPAQMLEIVAAGERLAAARESLAGRVTAEAWQVGTGADHQTLSALPAATHAADFAAIAELADALPDALDAGLSLAALLGEDPPRTVDALATLTEAATAVVGAPPLAPQALAAPVWDDLPGAPADLVAALDRLQSAKAALDGKLTESAWEADLSPSRATLASHGSGLFRFLSGEWRRANRLVRTYLCQPDQPLTQTLAQLDQLQKGRAARAEVQRDDSLGREAFGAPWRGERSDLATLSAAVTWARGLGQNGRLVRQIIAREPDPAALARLLPRLAAAPRLRDLDRRLGALLGPAAPDMTAPERARLAVALTASEAATQALLTPPPPTLGERLERLATLDEGRIAAQQIAGADALAAAGFGALWQGEASDWPRLRAAGNWVRANADILPLAAAIADRERLKTLADSIESRWPGLVSDTEALAADLDLDLAARFGAPLDSVLSHRLTGTLQDWSRGGESLFRWTAYRDRAERGRALGCAQLVDRLTDGSLSPARVIPAFEMAYYEALHDALIRREPELGRFDGSLHSRKVAEFADLDQRRIRVSADETVKAHYSRVPPREGSAIGPLGTLRNELQKKRGHMPIRKLIERAAPALQALKPVFMMSPLSVAQFLPAGLIDFDLLVMDEASQIQPVDALGAVARARQVVVVGDPRQLPPTAFFSRLTSGGSDDDDDGASVSDIESILGLFTARGLPMAMLRWHYRSRHQSLIAVSNRQFYENKLFVVPSPYTAEAGMGLRFHHIPNGIFDTGGKRCNMVEAKIVARAIIAHALETPELSLGVATFSVAQRRAILDELELLRRARPETEGFFHAHAAEPFFVKNLENVQGDERDVIFISVGYGPSVPGGRVPMRFGPLGSDGGERRLNVLISRAKQRCEVFASMTDEDIEPDFAQTRKGVFAFRLFLQFARTGHLTMAEATGRDHDSVFEEQVANALQSRGYRVHRQVGLAGFFIDLAVSDPERPGKYLLGIECDGVAYHDSLSARDRDRLRQSVLESHGWHIHRLWSADWFQRPQQELDRIVAAIEAARLEDEARPAGTGSAGLRITTQDVGDWTLYDIEPATGAETAEPEGAVRPYVEASVQRPAHVQGELHEAPRGILADLAEQIVTVEGPVHLDEVVIRIRQAWGLARAGGRIRDAVAAGVDLALRKGSLRRDGDFLTVEGRLPDLRDRAAVQSTSLRKPEMLPLDEIAAGAVLLVRQNFGAEPDQLVTELARALGFKATGETLRLRLLAGIDLARGDGRLVEQNGLLQAAP